MAGVSLDWVPVMNDIILDQVPLMTEIVLNLAVVTTDIILDREPVRAGDVSVGERRVMVDVGFGTRATLTRVLVGGRLCMSLRRVLIDALAASGLALDGVCVACDDVRLVLTFGGVALSLLDTIGATL